MANVTVETDHLPGHSLEADRVPGHWLLARLGKTVLRPGGRQLTESLLAELDVTGSDDVLELAPGLGSTTELLLERAPASYTGVDRDPDAAARVGALANTANARVIQGTAAETGLGDGSVSVALGEAYLTMQPDRIKARILDELYRVLEPGGRVGLHEVLLVPDDIDSDTAEAVRGDLRSSIMVPICPATLAGWTAMVQAAGFHVDAVHTAPLHLLEPRRLVADEGVRGAARFVGRVMRDRMARRRVLAMRSAMRSHSGSLSAFVLTATKPRPSDRTEADPVGVGSGS